MNDGDIVIACQLFKKWFDEDVRDPNIGFNYRRIWKFFKWGLISRDDLLRIINKTKDLSEEAFNIIAKRVVVCLENTVTINSDSFIAICDTVDLPDEEFEFVSRRMQMCQLNNVSCGLAIKSCKKTSK